MQTEMVPSSVSPPRAVSRLYAGRPEDLVKVDKAHRDFLDYAKMAQGAHWDNEALTKEKDRLAEGVRRRKELAKANLRHKVAYQREIEELRKTRKELDRKAEWEELGRLRDELVETLAASPPLLELPDFPAGSDSLKNYRDSLPRAQFPDLPSLSTLIQTSVTQASALLASVTDLQQSRVHDLCDQLRRLRSLSSPYGAEVVEDEDFPEIPTRTVVPPPFPVRSQQHTYTLETVVAMIAVVYLTTYFLGKRKNDKLAISWLNTVKPLFEVNFSHVGVSEKPDGPLIQQEANHSYKFFASGRANCAYALLTLEMKKRQDLLSSCLQLVWPERDRMVLEIPIKPPEPLPLVFAVCRKNQAKQFRAGSEDLKSLTAICRFDELSASYAVLAENDETVRYLLNSKTLAVLHSFPFNSLDSLVISDQRVTHPGFPMTLRCECNLPYDPKDYQETTKVCHLMLKLVDMVCGFKLSATAKATSEKERLVQQESKLKEQKVAREEELQKKKLEQKKKEEEKKQSLSKEAQRKLEEKEYRQSLKKKGVKTKMIKA